MALYCEKLSMKIELQQLQINILKTVLSLLTKKTALSIVNTKTFRSPTKKESLKHQSLITKQRKRYENL